MFVFLLCIAITAPALLALEFPQYSYRNHPLYTEPFYARNRPAPMVVRNYHRMLPNNGWSTSKMYFLPNAAGYNDIKSGSVFAENLDALFTPRNTNSSRSSYVKVTLNRRARVFLLMTAEALTASELRKFNFVSGLSEQWKIRGGVQSPNGDAISFGKRSRVAPFVVLPKQAAVVEREFEADEQITLPHPGAVTVNNRVCNQFTLLFAKPTEGGVEAFQYPTPPSRVLEKSSGREVATTTVAPNARCPLWLHDMHVAASRDKADAAAHKEPTYWRTWHPAIDPIFWCYYDHEHGSYPGLYRPLFHYTAYKTLDLDARNRRQQESHNGFKCFAFKVRDEERFVVMVVHLHLSRARRFVTRRHTAIFAVVDSSWRVQLELQMKMDFGAGTATLANGSALALSAADSAASAELAERGVLASRRFNVLSVDAGYPASVDRRFLTNAVPNGANREEVLKGIYEQWSGPLNSCSRPVENKMHSGLRFDVRDPSTALRYTNATSDESMQQLLGANVNRFINIQNTFEVAPQHCAFGGKAEDGWRLKRGGVFYTDPYFESAGATGGYHRVRQFMQPHFKPLRLEQGVYLPVDMWNGEMKYKQKAQNFEGTGRVENVEGAIIRSVN